MNAKVFTTYDCAGLLRTAFYEHTDESLATIAPTNGRGFGGYTVTIARVVELQAAKSLAGYLTPEEQAEYDFASAVRSFRQASRRANPSRRAVKVAHVAANIDRWLTARSYNAGLLASLLGAGWWRKPHSGSATIQINELAALIRCLHACTLPAAENDESPFADADNGRCPAGEAVDA